MQHKLLLKIVLSFFSFLLLISSLGASNSYYYFWLAERATEEHAFSKADSLLQIAQRLDPESEVIVIKRLENLYYEQNYAKIIQVAQQEIQYNFNDAEIFIMLADALLKTDKIDKAEEYLRQGLQKEAEDKENIYFEMAKIKYQKEELKKAKENLKKAEELSENDVDFLYKIARYYARMGEEAEYINLLEEILNIDPDYYKANIWLGDYYYSQKNYDTVIEYLQEAIEKLKSPPSSSVKQLVISYFVKEDYESALALAERAPDYYFDLRVNKLLFLSAFRSRKFEEVIKYGNMIIKSLSEEDVDIRDQTYELMGISYFTQMKLPKSYESFEKIKNNEILLSNSELIYSLSLELKKSGLIRKMINYVKGETDSSLVCNTQINYAYFLSRVDSVEKAKDLLKQIDEQDCESDEAKRTFAMVVLNLNSDLKRAEEILKTRKNPTRTSNVIIGNWLVEDGRLQAAIPYFEEAVKDESEAKIAYTLLADTYRRLDDVEKELEVLREAVKRYPQDAQMLNWLGYAYAENKTNLDKAIDLLKRAVRLDSENVYIWDSLAWAYYQDSNYEKALESMQIVIENEIEDTVVRYHLGNIFWKLGEKEKAINNWKKAIEIANDDEGVKQAESMLKKVDNN